MSEWDKLKQQYLLCKPIGHEWIRELIAEGDRLQEKAEKWDKYTLNGENITPEIIEAIEVAQQKLESIEKHLVAKSVSYPIGQGGQADIEDVHIMEGRILEIIDLGKFFGYDWELIGS